MLLLAHQIDENMELLHEELNECEMYKEGDCVAFIHQDATIAEVEYLATDLLNHLTERRGAKVAKLTREFPKALEFGNRGHMRKVEELKEAVRALDTMDSLELPD